MQLSDTDFADIQGLARFGHGHLPQARFLLLRIKDPAAARSWLAARTRTNQDDADGARVTTAVKGRLPGAALQVAFTHQGLQALDVPPPALTGFSDEFKSGMAGNESRSRRLGDIGKNEPGRWHWGVAGTLPHVLVMLYAGEKQLEDWEAKVKGDLWSAAFSEMKTLDTNEIGDGENDIEPFGFRDGISQPMLDWERRKPARLLETREYTNVAALGEFLLGYPNEYGRYTCRPLLDSGSPYAQVLPLAEDLPGKRDLGRNGSYLVMRDLEQNVRGFWQFVDQAANGVARERRQLAHAMVGRMMSGDPLVPLSGKAIDGVGPDMNDIWLNQFTFHVDPGGTACPYGAHIRRANPRNADLPEGTRGPISRMIRRLGFCRRGPHDDLVASTRFHRILRRGREYGPWLKPDDALKPYEASQDAEPDAERGLRFICLNANISRQFEFVQTAWLANAKFEGTDEGDPVAGNREPHWAAGSTDTFAMPQESGLPRRIGAMSQFVTVRGGGYFFMPGISALRYLARTSG